MAVAGPALAGDRDPGAKAVAAGMIVLGKTHTVEFAMGGWGTNHHMGTPWNPWDPEVARTPGGSSSGSGVAVASAMAPWAIGTDTGGSVRLPASWCGIAGLKTTVGRVSCHGILPLAPSLDTPGPMARSVEDAALLFSVMQGADPLDRLTLSAPPPVDPFPSLRRGVNGCASRACPRPSATAATTRSSPPMTRRSRRWRPAPTIVEVAFPRRFRDFAALTGQIIGAEGYSYVGDIVDRLDLPVDEAVRPRYGSAGISARDYLGALARARRSSASSRRRSPGSMRC